MKNNKTNYLIIALTIVSMIYAILILNGTIEPDFIENHGALVTLVIPEVVLLIADAKEKNSLKYTRRLFSIFFVINIICLLFVFLPSGSILPNCTADAMTMGSVILIPGIAFLSYYYWQKRKLNKKEIQD